MFCFVFMDEVRHFKKIGNSEKKGFIQLMHIRKPLKSRYLPMKQGHDFDMIREIAYLSYSFSLG